MLLLGGPDRDPPSLLERGLLKMFYGRDEVVLLLVTYAVFLILEDVTKLIWGVNPIYATQPYELFGNLEFAGSITSATTWC